jgi:hypothetical protein
VRLANQEAPLLAQANTGAECLHVPGLGKLGCETAFEFDHLRTPGYVLELIRIFLQIIGLWRIDYNISRLYPALACATSAEFARPEQIQQPGLS